ncbi:MAG TPA: hypothetical protein VIA18_30440, partial [Polyangia bacterium]|nr:hypothetical protein [Polyangia bacterium]
MTSFNRDGDAFESPDPIPDDNDGEPGWQVWRPQLGPLTRTDWLDGLVVDWLIHTPPKPALIESLNGVAVAFREASELARDLAFEIDLLSWRSRTGLIAPAPE